MLSSVTGLYHQFGQILTLSFALVLYSQYSELENNIDVRQLINGLMAKDNVHIYNGILL